MITGVFTVMICLFIFAFLKFIYNVQRDKLINRKQNNHCNGHNGYFIRVVGRMRVVEDGEDRAGVHEQPFSSAGKSSLN